MKKIIFLAPLLFCLSCDNKTCLDIVEVHRNDKHHFVVTHKEILQLGRDSALYGFDFISDKDTLVIQSADALYKYITDTTFVSLFQMAEIGDTVYKDSCSLEYKLVKKDTTMVFHYYCKDDIVK